MSGKSFRVYFVMHEDGHRTGTLMRTWDEFFDRAPPSAYGVTPEDVFAELESKLERMRIERSDRIERYLWDVPFQVHRVRVDVHPMSFVKKRPVIAMKEIPLLLHYAACALEGGGYRIMVPRFGGWFIVEDLALAADVLRHAVGNWLTGENAKSIYDFRTVGDEYVADWSPPLLRSLDESASRTAGQDGEYPTISAVSEEWTERAAKGKLAPVIGASARFEAHVAKPHDAYLPSLLLVGKSGAGKTTFVRRLAFWLASQRKAKREKGETPVRLFATSADKILAGMVYLGMWQERCHSLVSELSLEGHYLYVDQLHGILRPQHDGSTIADFLEPAMAARELSIIAECTESELERAQRTHPSLMGHMELIRLEEPETPAVIALLDAYAHRLNLPVHPAGLRRLTRHLAALSPGVAFPGKGFRFLDWLAKDGETRKSRTLYARDASEAYSRYSGVPLMLLSDDLAASAGDLANVLKKRVIGQDEACEACGRLLARFKANMVDPERPCGTLLFVGPTGVGKTELAKQLARATFGSDDRMLRLDMSEYMLPGSSRRLLESGGDVKSLASRVEQQPLSLVLLDEIEKAHPEVFDLLLGVLGEGRLTASSGRLVDFRSTIIVLTSNIGVSETRSMGFTPQEHGSLAARVRDFFRPELFNRLDAVLSFRALSLDDMERIVELELENVRQRTGFVRRGIGITATAAARRRIAEQGHHPTRGARPLKRWIEEHLVTPIAARMAEDVHFRAAEVLVVAATDPPQRGGESAMILRV
ncbi:AAA family ATPase [Pendulispora brunnea]|uniref:AAA family ATPase n=1 Tax=Pendulispora brunnea TaxID=2905690 RepID=A0ABZ2KCA4_9BACT